MHYVYLLRSSKDSAQTYTGVTSNLKERLRKHNHGEVPHTAKFKPWTLVSYYAFPSREKAAAFEAYLKSGSGRAFAKRRLSIEPPPRGAKADTSRRSHESEPPHPDKLQIYGLACQLMSILSFYSLEAPLKGKAVTVRSMEQCDQLRPVPIARPASGG